MAGADQLAVKPKEVMSVAGEAATAREIELLDQRVEIL